MALLEDDRRRPRPRRRSSTGIRTTSEPVVADAAPRRRSRGLLGAAVPDADVRPDPRRPRLRASHGVAGGWEVTVPTRRVDVLREVDLIEEIARHYGFDRLPVTFPGADRRAARRSIRASSRARQLRSVLTGAGFSEAVTFGFIAEAAAAPFAADGDLVPIANPLSENFAVLRPSALPGLVDAVAHNRRREQRDVRLFEIGARFSRAAGERRALACAWTGHGGADHWSGSGREVDFFDIKGVVERVCEVAGVAVETDSASGAMAGAGPIGDGDRATGRRLAVLGQLARDITDAHGLPGDPVYVAEIDLDALERASARTRSSRRAAARATRRSRATSPCSSTTRCRQPRSASTIRDAAPRDARSRRRVRSLSGQGHSRRQESASRSASLSGHLTELSPMQRSRRRWTTCSRALKDRHARGSALDAIVLLSSRMAKQAFARATDLDPIDRLEEKIKLLVEMVTRLRAIRRRPPTTTRDSCRKSRCCARGSPTPRARRPSSTRCATNATRFATASPRCCRSWSRSSAPSRGCRRRGVVTVEIAGQRYPIRSGLDPAYVAELAAYVDKKMRAAVRRGAGDRHARPGGPRRAEPGRRILPRPAERVSPRTGNSTSGRLRLEQLVDQALSLHNIARIQQFRQS